MADINCPTCLDCRLEPEMGLAPGLEDQVTYYRCTACNGAWTPLELDRMWSVDGQIQRSLREDARRGCRGGSGGLKGRREDKPGMRQAREERRRNRTLDCAPLGPPDPDPWAKGQDRITSSVHSTRLSAEDRRRLQRLREAYGESDADILRRGLQVLEAVETARPDAA